MKRNQNNKETREPRRPVGLDDNTAPRAIRVFHCSAAAHLDCVVENDGPEHSENHLEIVVDEVSRLRKSKKREQEEK